MTGTIASIRKNSSTVERSRSRSGPGDGSGAGTVASRTSRSKNTRRYRCRDVGTWLTGSLTTSRRSQPVVVEEKEPRANGRSPGKRGGGDGREPFPPAGGELVEVGIPDGQQAVEVRAAVGGAFGQRAVQPERPDPFVALADRQQPVEDRPVRRHQGRQRGRAAIDIHWLAGYRPVRTRQAAERSPGSRRSRGCWMAGGVEAMSRAPTSGPGGT